MAERTLYKLRLTINGKHCTRVIIDQHYREKHKNIDDELILSLVKTLDHQVFPIETRENGFEYFAVEPVITQGKSFRLVLLLCVFDDYLGVINAFRVKMKGRNHD